MLGYVESDLFRAYKRTCDSSGFGGGGGGGGRGCIHCATYSGENEWVQSMGKVLDFKNDDADNGGFHSELYTQSSKGTVPQAFH